MPRKTTLIVLAALVAVAAPVHAKKARSTTYYVNWAGDCAGSGYLSVKAVPNPDSCALFFPGLADTYSFPASDGLPFVLDAKKPIAVYFSTRHVGSVAAEFEITLSGEVDGADTEIASATETIVATGPGSTPFDLELQPDASLHGDKVTALALTVTWSGGFSYSEMMLENGDATVTLNRLR